MFPFVIAGLATPPAGSVVDVSWLNDPPAGGHGFVRAREGHFVDGRGQRLRFLASNFTFGSCFPDHADADKLAARLASLGINCIRFHHTDNQAAPRGIWKAGTPKKNEFDPDQLDRLDYFIAALKRHGIYADINNENSLLQLKVSSLPEYYRADVLKKWNLWLKARYGSSEKLAAAWGRPEELGTNLLPARLNTQGGQYLAVTNGSAGEICISLLTVPEVSWHAQLQWAGLTLEEVEAEVAKAAASPVAWDAEAKLSFDIGPRFKTLWYEIVVE